MWLDLVWVAFSVPIAFYLRHPDYLDSDRLASVFAYTLTTLVVAVPTFALFGTDSAMSRFFSARDAWPVAFASVVVAAVAAALQFTMDRLTDVPRSLPVLHAIVLTAGLVGGRLIARQRSRRRPIPVSLDDETENVIVIGANRLAWFYLRTVDEIGPGARCVVAILDRRSRLSGRSIAGRPVIGAVEGITRIVEEYGVHGLVIHRIVVAEAAHLLSPAAAAEIEALRRDRSVAVQWLDEMLFPPRQIASAVRISQTPAVAAMRNALVDRPYWAVKRVLDIAVATILVIVLAPIALLMVPLTMIDVGLPLMFWQNRVGRNGRRIPLYKFRTLRPPFDQDGNRLCDDKRRTWIGRAVRASRLDEIPQLLSVLRGDMSLVGPRPLLPIDQPPEIGLRLAVAPGLTGWAQIHGGKLVSAREKNALDEWYVRHASVWLDVMILLATPVTMFVGDRRNERVIALALAEAESHPQPLAATSIEASDHDTRSQDRPASVRSSANQQDCTASSAFQRELPQNGGFTPSSA